MESDRKSPAPSPSTRRPHHRALRTCGILTAVAVAAAGGYLAARTGQGSHSAAITDKVAAAAASVVTRTSGLSHVKSDDPTQKVKLRICSDPGPAASISVLACPVLDALPDGAPVTMRCWIDGPQQGVNAQRQRWFYVTEADSPQDPHPGRSGYVFSDLIPPATEQIRVPGCSQEIVGRYPYFPMKLQVSGTCTTAGGTLTSTSSGFNPGEQYYINATYPDGTPYTNLKAETTAKDDGSIAWSWPCKGDPAGTYTTFVVTSNGTSSAPVHFAIGPAPQQPTPSSSTGGSSTGGNGTTGGSSSDGTTTSDGGSSGAGSGNGGATGTGPSSSGGTSTSSTGGAGTTGAVATRQITVYDMVTNGATQMREDTPAYLSTATHNFCRANGCELAGTEVATGATLIAKCQAQGDRTTNGQDNNPVDDHNPGLYESTLWYGVTWPDGRFGYISAVWINQADRGGLQLPAC